MIFPERVIEVPQPYASLAMLGKVKVVPATEADGFSGWAYIAAAAMPHGNKWEKLRRLCNDPAVRGTLTAAFGAQLTLAAGPETPFADVLRGEEEFDPGLLPFERHLGMAFVGATTMKTAFRRSAKSSSSTPLDTHLAKEFPAPVRIIIDTESN